VDGSDYSRIDGGYVNHLSGWFNGDFNYDGIIDGSDYTLIDNAFNNQSTAITSAVAASAFAGVPEPRRLVAIIGANGPSQRPRPGRLVPAEAFVTATNLFPPTLALVNAVDEDTIDRLKIRFIRRVYSHLTASETEF
jgi:hypothetical protein